MLDIFIYLIEKYKSIQISLISRFQLPQVWAILIFSSWNYLDLTSFLNHIVPNSETWTVLHVCCHNTFVVMSKTTHNNEYLGFGLSNTLIMSTKACMFILITSQEHALYFLREYKACWIQQKDFELTLVTGNIRNARLLPWAWVLIQAISSYSDISLREPRFIFFIHSLSDLLWLNPKKRKADFLKPWGKEWVESLFRLFLQVRACLIAVLLQKLREVTYLILCTIGKIIS